MTTRATTWLAQIAVVLVLTAAGTASASSGLLGGNSPLGENLLEGRPHQASASVSAELRRGYGRRCWYDASDVSVEPVFNLEVEGDHCYRVGEQGLLVHNNSVGCVHLQRLGCTDFQGNNYLLSSTDSVTYTVSASNCSCPKREWHSPASSSGRIVCRPDIHPSRL